MSFAYGLEKIEPAFEDRPVPYIAYGARFHELTATHLNQTLAAERVFIIASTSLSTNTPSLSRLENAIKENCPETKLVGTHIGIPPHTPWDSLIEITNKARTAFSDKPLTDKDILITLGGGSLTDGAKIIAWLLSNPQIKTTTDLDTMHASSAHFSASSFSPPIIRVITIPTTLSGGEYSSIAGASRTDTPTPQKCLFTPPTRNPSLVILDPALTTTTPAPIYLSTGVRAIDHCIETLCSLASTSQADESADQGLKALVPGLLATKADPTDLAARFSAILGVKHAMSAVSAGVPLGGSHAIGHQLGPLGVGHGETSCIMLPAVCKYNASHNANNDRQAICRDVLIQIAEVRQLVEKRGKGLEDADLGDTLDLVIRALGLPRTLKDVGVGRDRLDGLARNTLTDHWAGTNPVPLTKKEQVLEILEMVVE